MRDETIRARIWHRKILPTAAELVSEFRISYSQAARVLASLQPTTTL